MKNKKLYLFALLVLIILLIILSQNNFFIKKGTAPADNISANNISKNNLITNNTSIETDNDSNDNETGDNITNENISEKTTIIDNSTTDNNTADNVTIDNSTNDNTTNDNITIDNTTLDNETIDNLTADNSSIDNVSSENNSDNNSDNISNENIVKNPDTTDNYTVDNGSSHKKIRRGHFFTNFSKLKFLSYSQKLIAISADRLKIISVFLDKIINSIKHNNFILKEGKFIVNLSDDKYIVVKFSKNLTGIGKDKLIEILSSIFDSNHISTYFNFPFNKYNVIFNDQKPILQDLIKITNQIQKTNYVFIFGHTDNIGTQKYNMELSLKRADYISNYLEKNQNIIIIGCGENLPIANNNTDTGRAKNRRVEIIIKTLKQ